MFSLVDWTVKIVRGTGCYPRQLIIILDVVFHCDSVLIHHWVQVVDWISGMCSEWDTPLEECQEGVAWAMPRILAALSGYDRQWVNDFCGTWGAC